MSFWELLVIVGVALVAFGPDKIPRLAHNLGRMLSYFQQAKSSLNEQIQEAEKRGQLELNESKARQADKVYQTKSS